MSTAAVSFEGLSLISCRETDERKSAVFNDDIDFNLSKINTVSGEREKNIEIEREQSKKQLLEQLNNIVLMGSEWNDDGIQGPNEFTVSYAKELIPQLVINDTIPIRITQSIEEGISFVFKNKNQFFYLEIYNDKEIGFLIEDYINKSIIKNKEVKDQNIIFDELHCFFNCI